jgi:hypothetical protein
MHGEVDGLTVKDSHEGYDCTHCCCGGFLCNFIDVQWLMMFVFTALEQHRATLICDTKHTERIKAHDGCAVPNSRVSSVAATAAKQF